MIFRRKADNSRHIFSLDYLLDHLREWERPYKREGVRGKREAGVRRKRREMESDAR